MIPLVVESWIWYGFVVLIIIVRYLSRWQQMGSLKRFQAEDYLMAVVLVFYTVLITCMNIVSHLESNLMLPEDVPRLTPTSIAARVRGSKMVLVVEQSMILTIWGCKISLLLLYSKLTIGLKQHLAVKIVAAYVVATLVIMEILYLGVWCRPFNQYWAVPVENIQCSTALHHLITNTVFNLTSDVMMLCIPFPILINSQLPRAKKLILCVLFGMGGFVIICAVLNKYYSFHDPFSPDWMFWYIREASTALLVANLPLCWTLARRVFNLRSFNNNSEHNSKSKSLALSGLKHPFSRAPKSKTQTRIPTDASGPRTNGSKADKGWWDNGMANRLGKTESEEYIVESPKAHVPMEVWETTVVEVERASIGQGPMGRSAVEEKMFDGSGGKGSGSTTIVTAVSTPQSGRKSSSSNRS